ncbi:MAG TPA: DUF971 domain-containing protein [Blastocatellia bacterium]|nr:DUF971 domain-containing protein [Blastocatellia bacterium]
MATPIPTEIKKTDFLEITVRWDDGHLSVFPIKYLRSECACARCVSEVTGLRILDPRTVSDDLTVTGAEHVGRYGIKFYFSDRHDDGIYTWERLRELCPCDECSASRASKRPKK